MKSPSDGAWLGCKLDAGGGKVFVQLVGPGALFERKVLASAFGSGEEDALEKAMRAAGVSEVQGQAEVGSTLMDRMSGMLQADQLAFDLGGPSGLTEACRKLENAIERLMWVIRVN